MQVRYKFEFPLLQMLKYILLLNKLQPTVEKYYHLGALPPTWKVYRAGLTNVFVQKLKYQQFWHLKALYYCLQCTCTVKTV